MRAQEFITEGQEKKPVTIYTNPANKGATIDDSIKKSLPVTQISFDKLQQWESHKTMQDPRVADWVNNKLLPELQQNGTLDPLSVWNDNGELFVIDGNHRFVAYQQAGYRGRVPVQIVPDFMITIVDTVMSEQAMAENKAAGINKMFNNLGDPVYANLQRVALLAMQGRQSEAAGRLQTVIKDADPAVQKKIIDAVNNIKPVTINGKIADSSTLDKSKQHNDWIINTFIPWVQSLLGQQGVAEGATVTRIDSKPITDFGSSLKAYKHTDDWSQSGVDTGDDSYWKNKNLKTNTTKGLFAGDPKRTALYATGNAHETRYVEFTQDGQPIVYFDRKDLPAMRSRKTYLTVFDANDFRQLPTGEWFSQNPGKPIKQVPIGDPFKYIASQGWIVRVTDDLDKVFKQVKNMHKAGKIAQYGAEGMNESKQGVAEARKNPEQNTKYQSGWAELAA